MDTQISKMEKSIFIITPIGADDSPARIHATMMYNKIFEPLSKSHNCNMIRMDFVKEGDKARLKKLSEIISNSSGVIADLYDITNCNVMYEIGIAHALDKSIYFLRPNTLKADAIPADFRYDCDYYSEYDLAIIDDNNRNAIEIKKIKENLDGVIQTFFTGGGDSIKYRLGFFERNGNSNADNFAHVQS